MRVIFGVGNPGTTYRFSRHNAGFLFLDHLAEKFSTKFNPASGDYYFAGGNLNNHEFLLIKPTTFVNNCGVAVQQVLHKYNIPDTELIVVCDDINLDERVIRLRLSGGDGGHNGLASIIYHLNSDQFPRLRIGIGKNLAEKELADYVLSDFTKKELNHLQESFEKAFLLIKEFILCGAKLMLEANSRLNKTGQQSDIPSDIKED